MRFQSIVVPNLKRNQKRKSFFFTCSVSRSVHLEQVENLTSKEFTKCFTRMVAPRGRPILIYSDNVKTFQVAAKWLKQLTKDGELHVFLTKESITLTGGQFKRIIALTKQALYKSFGKTNLNWNKLEEMLLDIEVNINNRPLTCIGGDIQYPALTPSSMILRRETTVLEENPKYEYETDGKKRQR